MLRKNNLGQPKQVTWGHLGKRRVLKNEVFEVIEKQEKETKYDWKVKLKPWNITDRDVVAIAMPEVGKTPTGNLWEDTTTTWDATTDNWDNI